MTAVVQISAADARQRIVLAAVAWVYDQSCSSALAELEDAVCDYIGRDTDGSLRRPEVREHA